MIAAIHQPNYIPWIGYFHKMANCDVFILLDSVEFSKNTVINRNKIKTPSGPIFLTVPVLHHAHQLIKDTRIDTTRNWRKKHWKSITQSYLKTKYFSEHKKFFEEAFSEEWKLLAELNEHIIRYLAREFGVKTKLVKSSELGVEEKATRLLINLCKAVGADTYLCGMGSSGYLEENLFKEAGLKVIYQKFTHPVYKQPYGNFMPKMSAIDLLFNEGANSKEIIAKITE